MSIVIPGMPQRKRLLPDPLSPNGGFEATSGPVGDALSAPDTELQSRFNYSSAGKTPGADNAKARANILSHPTKVEIMDLIPEGDTGGDYLKLMARDATNRARSQFNSEQVAKARAERIDFDQRRQQAIEEEARQIEAQQKFAAGEAARRFEEKYGVPYDKDSAKFVMGAERTQEIENDYAQKMAVLQSYMMAGVDSSGKPYGKDRFAYDQKQLAISRGLALAAPQGYYQAVAPSDPYGLMNSGTFDPSMQGR